MRGDGDMQDMTMREAGRDGVLLAIRDGMMAGKMSKENDELLREIDEKDEEIRSLRLANEVLTREIETKNLHIERLKRTVKGYQDQHMACYQKLIERQLDERTMPFEKAKTALCWISVGVIFVTIMVSLILMLK